MRATFVLQGSSAADARTDRYALRRTLGQRPSMKLWQDRLMLAVGVDLSAEDTKTWMASLELLSESAILVSLEAQVSNEQIVEAAGGADKIGIDCPFGWPVAFVEFVNEHMSGSVSARPGRPIDWRRHLAYRETDRFVIKETGVRPLSVAADRIGHAAMRCAALLAELGRAGFDVDRSGIAGALVEVYPAASLQRWHLTQRGYKSAQNTAQLGALSAYEPG